MAELPSTSTKICFPNIKWKDSGPNSVILDLEAPIRRFEQTVGSANFNPMYVCEILDTIINHCLRHEQCAERQLREFVEEVSYARHAQDAVGVDILPQHANAIMELGLATYRHLLELDIYDNTGELLYQHDLDFAPYHHEVVLFRS